MSRAGVLLAGMPRAAKWALVACGLIVVYFGVVEPALDFTRSMNERADRIENNLRRDKQLKDPQSPDRRLIDTGKELFGTPMLPTDTRAAAETLYRVVDRVLKDNGVEDASIAERSGRLTSDQLVGAIGSAATVDRFILEVSFDAQPEVALDVLSALEQSPEVSAVGRVRIDKAGVRSFSTPSGGSRASEAEMVRVTLSPELWMVKGPGGGQ